MAGMNLNPYGLNNNKNFSNHYSGNKTISSETINQTKKETNQYLKAYGFRTTDPKDMDLSKKVKKENNNLKNLLIVLGILLLGIIVILLAIFL